MELPLTLKRGWENVQLPISPSASVKYTGKKEYQRSKSQSSEETQTQHQEENVEYVATFDDLWRYLADDEDHVVYTEQIVSLLETSGLLRGLFVEQELLGLVWQTYPQSLRKKELWDSIQTIASIVREEHRDEGQEEGAEDEMEFVDRFCSTLIAAQYHRCECDWNVCVFLAVMDSSEMADALAYGSDFGMMEKLRHLFLVIPTVDDNLVPGDDDVDDHEGVYCKAEERENTRRRSTENVDNLLDDLGMRNVTGKGAESFMRDLKLSTSRGVNPDHQDQVDAQLEETLRYELNYEAFVVYLAFHAFDAYGDRKRCLGEPCLVPRTLSFMASSICEGLFRVVTSPKKSRDAAVHENPASIPYSPDSSPSSPILKKYDSRGDPASGESAVRSTSDGREGATRDAMSSAVSLFRVPQRQLSFESNCNGSDSMESDDSIYAEERASCAPTMAEALLQDKDEYKFVDDVRSDEYDSEHEDLALPGRAMSVLRSKRTLEKDISVVNRSLLYVVQQLKEARSDIAMVKKEVAQHAQIPRRQTYVGLPRQIFHCISVLCTVLVAGALILLIYDQYASQGTNVRFSCTVI